MSKRRKCCNSQKGGNDGQTTKHGDVDAIDVGAHGDSPGELQEGRGPFLPLEEVRLRLASQASPGTGRENGEISPEAPK